MRILTLHSTDNCDSLRNALRTSGLGYELIPHSDVASLLNTFEISGGDLLIVDWQLWAASRLCEFHHLSCLAQGIPLIALLSSNDPGLETIALSWGVQETLTCSRLNPVEVLRVVTRAIQRCAQAKKLSAEIVLLKTHNKALERLARLDPLTGLTNRQRFTSFVDAALTRAARHESTAALLCMDIDRFELINVTYGHEIGDEVLCWFAHRLRDHLRTSDHLACIGGDEFVLVIEDISNPSQAYHAAQKVHELLSEPVTFSGIEIDLRANIGIALYPQSRSSDELIRHANIAMCRAKQSLEVTRIRFFDSALDSRLRSEARMQRELTESLDSGELTVAYQPIYNYAENRVTSAEALFRWPARSEYDIEQVISLAEANSLIRDIDRNSVNTVLTQLTNSPIQGLNQVSVNSSLLTLDQAYLRELMDQVANVGPLPFTLCLELTETAVAGHFANMKKLVQQLRRGNFKVALDDFGTGYASLKYVRELNVDYLKLDRELVRDVERDPSARAICAAAIDMAHNLGISVVAEGIASEDQFETLRELNCDYAQGYYIARPRSLTHLADICAA